MATTLIRQSLPYDIFLFVSGPLSALHNEEYGDHETLIVEVFDQTAWWQANVRFAKYCGRIAGSLTAPL